MPSGGPNFSPFPFAGLRRLTRREAALESAIAGWCRAHPRDSLTALASLFGAPVRARVVGVRGAPARSSAGPAAATLVDPDAALAEVRLAGQSFVAAGSSHAMRKLAQHVLGGPDEIPAPRPLTPVEHALWSLVVATALEDLGIAAEVWPLSAPPVDDRLILELLVESPRLAPQRADVETLVGIRRPSRDSAPPRRTGAMTVLVLCPPDLSVRPPPPAPCPRWTFELALVVARSAIPSAAVRTLRVSDIVTVERGLELALGAGRIPLSAPPRAMEAAVASGYVPRDMALPDEAHLELTVEFGKARLSLRQLADLAPGQIIPLGRPLAGPYEVRAGGRLIGHGELVDIEGELGVRIVSLVEE